MNDHRSYVHSLSSCEMPKVWKNIEPLNGFEPITKQRQQRENRTLLYQLLYQQLPELSDHLPFRNKLVEDE